MIKVSDFIVKRLTEHGVRHVFMVSGGGAMHLNDSVGRSSDIEYICNHHEQACAIAAEGYARVSGRIGVVVVTSGPGGTNALTGVIGQWLDSVPALYLSGQVKRETTLASCREIGLRQLGDQEINIIDMVRPVTKFAAMVMEPQQIRYLLDKAIAVAMAGRPGPVWLDIPLDVQGALVDEESLEEYDPAEAVPPADEAAIKEKLREVLEALRASRRPVLLAGNGIRIAGAQKILHEVIEALKIPVVVSFNGNDLVAADNPYFAGKVGTIGDRPGNFALQNSDLLLSVGSRNNIRQVSYNWKSYARAAKKVIVDIDGAELRKPTVIPDIAVLCDAGIFLSGLLDAARQEALPDYRAWVEWCSLRKKKYPVVNDALERPDSPVDPYYFIKTLTKCMPEDSVMVTANGTASLVGFQASAVKKGQRTIWNSGCTSMGYDLPAAIGASIALGRGEVVCLAGDGSIQMNIQELETISHYGLPVKIFVLNNSGYISIKQTQDAFFAGHYVACRPSCGVTCPDMTKIASSYGIKSMVLDRHSTMPEKIREVLGYGGPCICVVELPEDYLFSPKLSSEKKPDGRIVSKPLEDMYPFLPRDEFRENMLIPLQDE
ncbi:MAG: thiamine pyrophosphate-binding protein [Candidatus Eremiobacteraeota bacterium]|nr:thiamine pyrophosphate-binding protein [Candidatus Eremiobacteraeota bacterium]